MDPDPAANELELRHLRYFVAVAQNLHFGKAALHLHIAQPALSQQVKRLEQILGCALFIRTSRSVKLTSAGEVFLSRAQRLLRTVRDDVEEARSIAGGQLGSLKLGFIGSCMLTALPNVLERYRNEYPGVQLQLHESFTSLVIHGLLSGSLDAGFLRDGGSVEGLYSETIFAEPFIAVLPQSHPAARRRNFTLAVLRNDPFVFYSPTAGRLAYDKPLSLCEEYGFRPKIVQEASHWVSILSLIGAGLGVSIAPACVEKIAPPDVICRKLRGVKVSSNIEFAYRSGEDRSVVHSFAAIARRCFAQT